MQLHSTKADFNKHRILQFYNTYYPRSYAKHKIIVDKLLSRLELSHVPEDVENVARKILMYKRNWRKRDVGEVQKLVDYAITQTENQNTTKIEI